jgi:hypothetical protein
MAREGKGAMEVFASVLKPGRFTVHLGDHIIGVLRMTGNEVFVDRLKLGRNEDGSNVFVRPAGKLAYLSRAFDSTGAAADKVLEHWEGLRS